MKKLGIILTLFIITVSCKGNENKATDSLAASSDKQEVKLKRYEVKSAIVTYKTTITGKVMGSTITGSGAENLYFKNWGNVELKEEQSTQTTHTNIFGINKTKIDKTHVINKLDNGKSYTVDFKRKKIMLRRDGAMEMTKMFADGDVSKTAKQMLEGMGGKIVGQESILGYKCDIWDVMGTKQWLYKGLPLKIEATIMGITTTSIATSAKFNVSVPDKYFELPNFQIEEMEGYQNDEDYSIDQKEMKPRAQKMKNMSYAEFKEMTLKNDSEAAEMSEEEWQQNYKMFKIMINKMNK